MNPVSEAVHKAVYDGKAARVKRLVQGGKNVNEKDRRGLTPLHVATIQSNKDIAVVLINLGADVKATTENLWTVLHICGQYGGRDIATVFLDKGVNIQATDMDEWTPLHVCASHDTAEVAKLFLQRGAQVDPMNKDQWTPLHISAEKGSVKVAQALLDYAADVNAVGKDSWMPLHMCAREDSVEIAQILLQQGAQIEALASNGRRPLHICARYGSMKTAVVLIEKNAVVEAEDDNGDTPLKLALTYNHSDFATRLSSGVSSRPEEITGSQSLVPRPSISGQESVQESRSADQPGSGLSADPTIMEEITPAKPEEEDTTTTTPPKLELTDTARTRRDAVGKGVQSTASDSKSSRSEVQRGKSDKRATGGRDERLVRQEDKSSKELHPAKTKFDTRQLIVDVAVRKSNCWKGENYIVGKFFHASVCEGKTFDYQRDIYVP